jgi:hypothetical protein
MLVLKHILKLKSFCFLPLFLLVLQPLLYFYDLIILKYNIPNLYAFLLHHHLSLLFLLQTLIK